MRIAHFGTFDVDNYGDLLFPHIAEWRWPDAAWVHVSPTSTLAGFADARPVIDVRAAASESFDAVVVGGGNILRLRRSSLPVYADVAASAYPSLWLGAAELAAARDVPLLINGPSIATPRVGALERVLLGRTLDRAAYAALRDPGSVATASSTGSGAVLAPDTAFDVARMWPLPAAEGAAADDGPLAIHLNKRYVASIDDAARKVDALAAHRGGKVRLIPIGPCHGDVATLTRLAAAMQADAELVPVTTLKDMAHAIARSSYYVGSSMHGFITALAYGRPAMLVLNDAPLNKFEGVLQWAGLPPGAIRTSWSEVPDDLPPALRMDDEAQARVRSSLDLHWERLVTAAEGGGAGRGSRLGGRWRTLARLAELENKVTKRVRRLLP